ncbi:MAG: MATE family efflux transporter [Ruminococcus sp.]|nr:MATE family efflux transporter [Ruminococcus sp.]
MKKLTEGSPIKLILSFSMPLLFGNIFQLFYNLADTRIVGETLGENALAALGATSAINTVIIGFLNGLTNGFSLLTARFFGAKDEKHMRHTVAATLVLGFATAAVLTLLSLVFLDPLLHMLNTPDDIFSQAKTYIRIIFAGMAVTMCYNICASILRAVGDTVTPLVFLIISTLVNVFLDILFIKGFGSNVEGAAYATLISQFLSVMLCVIYIFRKYRILIPDKESFKFSANLAGEMYATGLSMGLMISLVGIGTVIMQGTINIFGTDIIVSHTASRKISDMFMMPISVFGMAAATFAGQNYGAGKIKRVKQGVYSATIITWVWSLIVVTVAYAFTPFLTHLITGIDNAEIIDISRKYLWINTPFYFVLDIVIVFRNALQGVGDKITPILSSILELAGKFAVAVALAPRLGYFGVMISEPLVWIGMAIILAIGFYHNKAIRKGKITADIETQT